MTNQKKTMLVVDDHIPMTNLIAEIFGSMGYSVAAAHDGFTALSEMRSQLPEILLSDLNMPGMSGFELLSIVRRKFPTVAVIAMSGSFTCSAVPHGIPADAFYAKGTSSLSDLLAAVVGVHKRSTQDFIRTDVPIWIQGSFRDGRQKEAFITCPECLRGFASMIGSGPSNQQNDCPHCRYSFEIAIVEQTDKVDPTMYLTP